MCTLTNAMLREKRISMRSGNMFISNDEVSFLPTVARGTHASVRSR
jgi:hypothetical protein